MRDITSLFVRGLLPSFRKLKKITKEPALTGKIKENINKVRVSRYIAGGQVIRLTSYFHVTKEESDIRIVYNLKSCRLNSALWAPYFWMHTIHNLLDFANHVS